MLKIFIFLLKNRWQTLPYLLLYYCCETLGWYVRLLWLPAIKENLRGQVRSKDYERLTKKSLFLMSNSMTHTGSCTIPVRKQLTHYCVCCDASDDSHLAFTKLLSLATSRALYCSPLCELESKVYFTAIWNQTFDCNVWLSKSLQVCHWKVIYIIRLDLLLQEVIYINGNTSY